MEEKNLVSFKYIEMDTFVSNNCIDIKEIYDFEALINEKNIKIIFYGKRTARSKYNPIIGECFLFIIDNIFYVFTYHSNFGVFKTINDYKNAKVKGFSNAIDYYIANIHNFKVNNEVKMYILKQYSLNVDDIYEYNKISDYKFNEVIKKMDIIYEIENNRKKYILEKDITLILYFIYREENNKIIEIENFIKYCFEGDDYVSGYDKSKVYNKINFTNIFVEKCIYWENSNREIIYDEIIKIFDILSEKKIIEYMNDKKYFVKHLDFA